MLAPMRLPARGVEVEELEEVAMLELSADAVRALSGARAARGLSEEYALRVHAESRNGTRGLSLQFAQRPLVGDQVGESEGMKLFVARELVEALEGQIIDVDSDAPQGNRFRLRGRDDAT